MYALSEGAIPVVSATDASGIFSVLWLIIAPPLVITREEADWAIERFEAALKAKPRTRRDAAADALHAATA